MVKIGRTPEQRMYLKIEAEIRRLKTRIESLKELINFCKIKIDQNFLNKVKKGGK